MLPSTYEACRDWVWNGFDGQKDDRAPGENFATAYGVTEYTWAYAIHQGLLPAKPIAEATKADCDAVLRGLYWNVSHCSALPPGANLMVFNDSVLTGTGAAGKLLQRTIGFEGEDVDGVVGPMTIRRANSFGDRALIMGLKKADMEYLHSLAKFPLYGRGWTRREDECFETALQMAGIPK